MEQQVNGKIDDLFENVEGAAGVVKNLKGILRTYRNYECGMIVWYIRKVASKEENSNVQHGLERVAREIENGKHTERYYEEKSETDVDIE